MTTENTPFKDAFPIENKDFPTHVSFQGCKSPEKNTETKRTPSRHDGDMTTPWPSGFWTLVGRFLMVGKCLLASWDDQ